MKMLSLALAMLLGVSSANAKWIKKYDQARFLMPCDAKVITNIWVDNEHFWNGDEVGPIVLTKCAELVLHVDWQDSIVIEWFSQDEDKQIKFFRFRLHAGGYIVPEDRIPQSNRRQL